MTDSRADDIVKQQERLKSERGVFESHWQEIAELVRPMRADFTARLVGGAKRTGKVFDGTPGLAAENMAAGLWGMVTNSANDWFQLRHPIEEINQRREVRLWLDACAGRIRDALSANGQRFYAKVLELYQDLVTFGTAVFYTEEMPARRRVFYSCRHLAECFIAEDDRERIDTLYRKFEWTARQAMQRWGDRVSEPIRRCADRGEN